MKSAETTSAKHLMKLTRVEKILLLLEFALEKVQKFLYSKTVKVIACLSIFVVAVAIGFVYKPQALSLPACNTLPSDKSPILEGPDANCLYYGKPLCKNVQYPEHRVNCADLIDLPLCSDIVVTQTTKDGGQIFTGITPQPGKNCVELCSEHSYDDPNPAESPPNVRGIDYAIHNKQCLRFCDSPEAGIIAKEPDNCVARKCNQLPVSPNPNAVTPIAGSNCQMLPCNLLTPDELNKPKFRDATKKYCEGSNIKCYKFTYPQLLYVKVRPQNTMCVIHDCTPASASCGPVDVLNVTDSTINSAHDAAYIERYQTVVNGGFDVNNKAYCNPVVCKPIVHTQYRCISSNGQVTGNNALDNKLNSACDLTVNGVPDGKPETCVNNYCNQYIDCNCNGTNRTDACKCAAGSPHCVGGYFNQTGRIECSVADNASDPGNIDPFDSWFYRPKPMDKATSNATSHNAYPGIPYGTGIVNPMSGNLCYSQGDMNDTYGWGDDVEIDLGLFTINLGWFMDYLTNDPVSPGSCSGSRTGDRGSGYLYLCGTNGLVYKQPSQNDMATYFKGYAVTDFSGTVPKHKVTVCTRFVNTISLNSCGARECGIFAMFDSLLTKSCGGDVCRDLVIEDSSETGCMMSSSINNNGCMADVSGGMDAYLRVRAVKYQDRICAFLDAKGQLAYNGAFHNGREFIQFENPDGIHDNTACVSDPNGSNGVCNGYNSNRNEGSASEWREMIRVDYVLNNRPASDTVRGYLDASGKLYKEQACPKVTLRIPPPNLYNLANVTNSLPLFEPPVTIFSASKIKGGEDAIAPSGEIYGKTDFLYPEITVQMGQTRQSMSVPFGATGYETNPVGNDPNSPTAATVSSVLNGKTYIAELFVRKEFSENNGDPLFCLYRKFKDQNGQYIDPTLVNCVRRNYPDINNASGMKLDSSLTLRKLMIDVGPNHRYDNAQMSIRYFDGGANKVNNGCTSDDSCTNPAILLSNPDQSVQDCAQDAEGYKICVQREECTKVYIECVQNEVDLRNAINTNAPTILFESKKRECNETLVPLCLKKRGISSSNASIYNLNPNNTDGDANAYGWFNEICVVSGFQNKLRKILARTTESGVLGKCFIDPTSPALASDPHACDAGGKAPDCICTGVAEGYLTELGQVVRLETTHEAGLCKDIPLPPFCPAINYNLNPNTADLSDLNYTLPALNNFAVGNAAGSALYINSGLNISHYYRAYGNVSNPVITMMGHAEFPLSLPGMSGVKGTCSGYWTYNKSVAGVPLLPTLDCNYAAGNVAQWSPVDANGKAVVSNPCVRFTCPTVYTSGPDARGVYQGDYDTDESGENKGLKHGFALWSKYQKTSDFAEIRSAYACISGYKPINSTAIINAATGLITGYGGASTVFPTRSCDQLGSWHIASNSCQRIKCAAVNPPTPKSVNDNTAWAQWFASSGATFPETLASRSNIRTQLESIATGVCNNDIGFFQSPGGLSPSRECDYLGNWRPVKNPCVTSCNAIDDIAALSLNNGFAKWNKVIGEVGSEGVAGAFAGCAAGYVKNPYPPRFDINGAPLANANDLTRDPSNPERLCQLGVNNSGASASVWGNVNNGCINSCPGGDDDPRIGVGITSHSTKVGSVEINWPKTDFGKYAYYTNWTGDPSLFSASYFFQGRTNKYYLLRRYCNSNGKWSDPAPACSANSGVLGNAKYSLTNANAGYINSVATSTTEVASGVCSDPNSYGPAYDANNNSLPLPSRNCVFYDSSQYIDQVYLALYNNSQDCVKKSCPPLPAYVGVRAQMDAITTRTDIGTTVSGKCINNSKNKDNGIIYTSLATNTALPSRTCLSDGTWAPLAKIGPVNNNYRPDGIAGESNCKLGCDVSVSKPFYLDAGGGCGNGGWLGLQNFGFTLAHGQVIAIAITDVCQKAGTCQTCQYTAYCNDGVYVTMGDICTQQYENTCVYFPFNFEKKNWEARIGRGFPWGEEGSSFDFDGQGYLYNAQNRYSCSANGHSKKYIDKYNKEFCLQL